MRLDGCGELRCGELSEAVDEAEQACKALTLTPLPLKFLQSDDKYYPTVDI